ncbi:MAG: hypothetical protein JW913_13665 [Chitinispirillaceae bacterium]|nr:hypothetical protein [Chitinispirillaceae bacterium]
MTGVRAATIRFPLFLFLLLWPVSTNAVTKEELINQAGKRANPPKFGFSARFSSKTSFQNKSTADSGMFYFSPPNRSRVDFLVSKMSVSTCGDTTWTKAANGDVTRSVASSAGVPSGRSGSSSMSSPDLLSYLKKGDFDIVREDSTAVVVKMDIENGKQTFPFTFYIDPKAFVIKRMEFPSPVAGMFRIGYRYTLFEGSPVLDEVNTVMGNFGFSRVHLFDYKKGKKKSSFFRIF